MRVFLVRHGETDWNKESRVQGHKNIPLNTRGLDQAEKVGHFFTHTPLDRVLTSNLDRAAITAAAIAKGANCPCETTEDLRERSFGDWEGKLVAEFTALATMGKNPDDAWNYDFRPPNGESYADVSHRLEPLTQRLNATEERTAVVSHGGTLSVLLAKLLFGTVQVGDRMAHRCFAFHNAAVTELRKRPDGTWLLVKYNEGSHLA